MLRKALGKTGRVLYDLGPGLIYAGVIAIAAQYIGGKLPILGAPVSAIIIGAILGNVIGKPAHASAGTSFTSKKILQWSIILIGSGLSLSQVFTTGKQSFLIMLVTLSVAFISALLVGRLMRIPGKLTVLIGAGTGICGGSAIAAVSPIIEADEVQIAYSMSTIFLFNVVAVVIFPLFGKMLGFSNSAFGMWAGTAINDTSSVVAAGYAFSNAAGEFATIVKLTRSTMIIPIALFIALAVASRKRREHIAGGGDGVGAAHFSLARIFPWFILWFLVMSLLHTINLLPAPLVLWLVGAGKFMIVMALAAIGLNADFRKVMSAGHKPLLLGLIVWASVALSSLLIQRLTGFS